MFVVFVDVCQCLWMFVVPQNMFVVFLCLANDCRTIVDSTTKLVKCLWMLVDIASTIKNYDKHRQTQKTSTNIFVFVEQQTSTNNDKRPQTSTNTPQTSIKHS